MRDAEMLRENLPLELRQDVIWAPYRLERRSGSPRPGKVPHCGPNSRASSTDRDTWTAFHSACKNCLAWDCDGVGFFSPKGISFVDLDDCINDEGQTSALFQESKKLFLPSYGEISQSRRGVKLFVKAMMPGKTRNRRTLPSGAKLEVYGPPQFCAVTGDILFGGESLLID